MVSEHIAPVVCLQVVWLGSSFLLHSRESYEYQNECSSNAQEEYVVIYCLLPRSPFDSTIFLF